MNCIEITAETAEDLIKLVQALRKENLSESVPEMQEQKWVPESGDVQAKERLEAASEECQEEKKPIEELCKDLERMAGWGNVEDPKNQELRSETMRKAAKVLQILGGVLGMSSAFTISCASSIAEALK